MQFPRTFVIYDFETTGFDLPEKPCDVIEIGARRVIDGVVETERTWLIKAKEPLAEKITELTGITNELLEKDGVDELQAFKEFREFMADHPLVGHNIIRFDNPILARKIKTLLEEDWTPSGCYDTAGLFKAWYMDLKPSETEPVHDFCLRVMNMRSPVKFNLGHAHKVLGFDEAGIIAHRAAGDVEMVHRIYQDLEKKYADPPKQATLDEIIEEVSNPPVL